MIYTSMTITWIHLNIYQIFVEDFFFINSFRNCYSCCTKYRLCLNFYCPLSIRLRSKFETNLSAKIFFMGWFFLRKKKIDAFFLIGSVLCKCYLYSFKLFTILHKTIKFILNAFKWSCYLHSTWFKQNTKTTNQPLVSFAKQQDIIEFHRHILAHTL